MDAIKNASGVNILEQDQKVAYERLKVKEISAVFNKDADGNDENLGDNMWGILVNVKFENLMKNNSYGKIKNFSTRLIVQTEGGNKNGKIENCFSAKDNAIATAIDEAGGEICRLLGGTWDHTLSLDERCKLTGCEMGEYAYIRDSSPPYVDCLPLPKCPVGKYLEGYNPNGTAICTNLKKCEVGEYLRGFKPNGDPICKNLKQKITELGFIEKGKCRIEYDFIMGGNYTGASHTTSGKVKIGPGTKSATGQTSLQLEELNNECQKGCTLKLKVVCD